MTVPTPSRFLRYLTVVLRWLLIAFGVFALTVLVGTTITNNLIAKVYTATAQVQVRPNEVKVIPGVDPNEQSFDPTFRSEIEILQSPDFLLPVINDLSLDKAWAKRVFKSPDAQLSASDALAYLQKIVEFKVVRGTNIIEITVSSDEPQEAADIANAIASQYKTLRDSETPQPQVSPVRIISRAETPEAPSKPNKQFDFVVTIVAAIFLGIMAASFSEVILLLSRAAERVDN